MSGKVKERKRSANGKPPFYAPPPPATGRVESGDCEELEIAGLPAAVLNLARRCFSTRTMLVTSPHPGQHRLAVGNKRDCASVDPYLDCGSFFIKAGNIGSINDQAGWLHHNGFSPGLDRDRVLGKS